MNKLDQIAYISHSELDTQEIKIALGLQDASWVEDEVVATGRVGDRQSVTNKARLLFNYDRGIEIEILQYLEGHNYAEGIGAGEIGHVGYHWDGDGSPLDFAEQGGVIVQEVWTKSHTNAYLLKQGRKYHYTIWAVPGIPVYQKVIERIQPPEKTFAEALKEVVSGNPVPGATTVLPSDSEARREDHYAGRGGW